MLSIDSLFLPTGILKITKLTSARICEIILYSTVVPNSALLSASLPCVKIVYQQSSALMTELVISDNQIIRATKGLDALISSYQTTIQFHMSDGRDELVSTISKSFRNVNIVRSLLKVLVDFR